MELYDGVILWNYITGMYYIIVLRTELYYGITLHSCTTELDLGLRYENTLWGYITELDYGIILRNHTMGLHYRIRLRDYTEGLYYGII